MSKGHVVVNGALCKCKYGNVPDTLVVQSQQKAYINDSSGGNKLVANTMDLGMPLQAKTFGHCKLQPSSSGFLPCVPAVTGWTDPYNKVELSNSGQILTEKSKATCAIAGAPCIEFTWHGQTGAPAGAAVEDANAAVHSHLNPLVNVKQMVESQDNDLEAEVEDWERNEPERVVAVDCDLYLKESEGLKTPYLDSTEKLNFESSTPFITGLKAILGDDIKHVVLKEFMGHLIKGAVPSPKWEIDKTLSPDKGGYYNKGKIYLNEKLILKAEKDLHASWLLFRVMIEETGHYIDDLLRNDYDNIGGDAKGDEGSLFAVDFVIYNELLFNDFEYARFNIKGKDGQIRTFKAKVSATTPDKREKASQLVYTETKADDHGEAILKNGKKVNVEFFKIRGHGAVHEMITKKAAQLAGVKYDMLLAEGCAWPDAPHEANQNAVTTDYYRMLWILAFGDSTKKSLIHRSHNGDLQYWHSMAPAGDYTNQEVVDMIVTQAKAWYKRALVVKEWARRRDEGQNPRFIKENYDGLFSMGKILHMVQDSYSASHVFRNSKKEIIQIQSYTEQDSHAHGEADAVEQDGKWGPSLGGFDNSDASLKEVYAIRGALEAIKASKAILLFFKRDAPEDELECYLRETVYKFGYKDRLSEHEPESKVKPPYKYDTVFGADRKAGATLEKFK